VPGYVRLLTPKGALDLREECWNAFPYFKTTIAVLHTIFKLIKLDKLKLHYMGTGDHHLLKIVIERLFGGATERGS
jgi:hypothetical protein